MQILIKFRCNFKNGRESFRWLVGSSRVEKQDTDTLGDPCWVPISGTIGGESVDTLLARLVAKLAAPVVVLLKQPVTDPYEDPANHGLLSGLSLDERGRLVLDLGVVVGGSF